ncbi:MAG: helix-turn-helix transcriptional regulator [Lachnospiraceae bacterium]|nr:helix-turn-helix transcriptional regulator [Lachnospiraceae bacterium]
MKKGREKRSLVGILLPAMIGIVTVFLMCFTVKSAYKSQITEVNRWQSQVIDTLDRSRTGLAAEALRFAGNNTLLNILAKENPTNRELRQVRSELVLQYSGEVEIESVLLVDWNAEKVISDQQFRGISVADYDEEKGYCLQKLLEKYRDDRNCFVSVEAGAGEYRQFYVYMTADRHLVIFELNLASINGLLSDNELTKILDTCVYYDGIPFFYVGIPAVFEDGDYQTMRSSRRSWLAAGDTFRVFMRNDRTACLSKIDTRLLSGYIFVGVWLRLVLIMATGVAVMLVLYRYLKRVDFLNIQHTLDMAMMKQRIGEINRHAALVKAFAGLDLQPDEFMALEVFFVGDGDAGKNRARRCMILHLTDEHMFEALDIQSGKEPISDRICEVCRRFSMFEQVEIVKLNHQMLAIIIAEQTEVSDADLLSVSRQLQEMIRKETQLSVSIAIGEPYQDSNDFVEKVPELYRMTEQTFFHGTDSIFLQNRFEEKGIIPYPASIEQVILAELEKRNRERYEQQLGRFIERLEQTTPSIARCYLSVLATNIVNYTRLGANPVDSQIVQQIGSCETLGEIKAILCEIIGETPEKVEHKEAEFIRAVSELIEAKYSDPDFCLSDVAERLDITASYAGKKFRNSFSKSFNAYMAEFRVAKAAQLLRTTNYKVKEVGEQCGFRTTAYFVTIFKKQTEVSPQEYRESAADANI